MSHNVADDPNFVPRTGVLLAKSCIDCNRFLGAKHFWVSERATGKRFQACNTCMLKRVSPENYKKQQKWAADFYKHCQQLTKQKAVNQSKRWELEDMRTLADKELSNLDAALQLGRTYASVCAMRRRLGISARSPVEEWKILLATGSD